jgi:hypothetical protein
VPSVELYASFDLIDGLIDQVQSFPSVSALIVCGGFEFPARSFERVERGLHARLIGASFARKRHPGQRGWNQTEQRTT